MPNESFKEAFLHFIWQFQYFNKQQLTTVCGTGVHVLSTGFLNSNAGPDFHQARILLGNVEWHGQIEIHYCSSDWIKHKHHLDEAYNNVILHVVWKSDETVVRQDGTVLPILELKDRVDQKLISKFEQFVKTNSSIPCSTYPSQDKVDPFAISSMLEKCLVERLEQKAKEILLIHKETRHDWEETIYRWLGKCYGFKINSHPFLKLCEIVPYSLARKYRKDRKQIEALLFGAAGFLKGTFSTSFPLEIQKEYQYLYTKHSLQGQMGISEWKFLRLRPANFPTLRISQFCGFLSKTEHLYDLLFSSGDHVEFLNCVSQNAHSYWQDHYVFDKPSRLSKTNTSMGSSSSDSLVINGLLPLRFAFAHLLGLDEMKASVIDTFRTIKPEKNSLIVHYDFLHLKGITSFESQAITQLHHSYCALKKCLACRIGHELIQP